MRIAVDRGRRALLRTGAGLLLAPLLPAWGSDRAATLVLGKASTDPKKELPGLKAMVDYAAAGMADLGVARGEAVIAPTREELTRMLAAAEVDWVSDTLYSALLMRAHAGAELVLRSWKRGVAEYRTLFFTRNESPVRSLADLAGRRLALQDAGSTTAGFLPLVALRQAGLATRKLAGAADPVPKDTVGYLFAGAEVNITAWVHRGLVDAGAYSNLDFDNPDHAPAAMRGQLRTFHETDPVPRAVELLRPGLAAARRARLIERLLAAERSPEGRQAMQHYQETARFTPIDRQMQEAMERLARAAERMAPVSKAP